MRHIKEEDEYKPLGRNKGHIDSTKKLIFRTLIISSLNIVDLILSIISFNSECLTYFILKYITITITFLMWFCICSSYSFKKGSTPFGELGYTCLGCIFATVVISLEITILVFFIKNFYDLSLLAKISYFIHWIPVPVSIIIQFTHCCGCELFAV